MKIETQELNIYEIEKFYETLKEEIKKDKIVVDFENVNKIDYIAIQLLVSLKKTTTKENKQLEFININDEVMQKLSKCKFDAILGLKNE